MYSIFQYYKYLSNIDMYLLSSISIFFGLSLIFIFYILRNKKKKINCDTILANPPDIIINDIINAFYYANMNHKNIEICIFYNVIPIPHDQSIKIKSVFTIVLLKFLLHSTYTNFVFFMTPEGILEIILFDTNPIVYDSNRYIILAITHCSQNNLFTIKQNEIIFKNNNTKKTIHIIKETLKMNTTVK